AGEIGRIQLDFTDFADEADGVRRRAVFGVKAALGADDLELGKGAGVFVRFDKRQFGGIQLFFNNDGNVVGPLEMVHAGHQAVIVDTQAFGDRPEVLHLQNFTREQQTEGGVVVDDDAAIAVEDLAAWRQYRNGLNAVLLGAHLVQLRI